MSRANVETVKRAFDAYNRRDLATYDDLCTADFEYFPALMGIIEGESFLHSAFAAIGGGVYRGLAGLRSWHRDMQDTWGEEIRLQAERHFDLGDETLTFHVVHGRGSHSGAQVAMPGALVTRWRDGRIACWRSYAHRDDALRDLGVTENELEPIAP